MVNFVFVQEPQAVTLQPLVLRKPDGELCMARSAENDWVVAMNDVSVGASRSKINAGYAARQLQRRTSFGKFRQSLRLRRSRKSMAEKSCKELALEGERLCKEGFVDEGIEKLESAIRVGTTDKKTLSALYSQLGNAYFYQEKYSKCLECHNSDLRLTRDMGDKLGEAKACGNIGNALKAMGQYDESIACCRMQLDLAREVSNKVSLRVAACMQPPAQGFASSW